MKIRPGPQLIEWAKLNSMYVFFRSWLKTSYKKKQLFIKIPAEAPSGTLFTPPKILPKNIVSVAEKYC